MNTASIIIPAYNAGRYLQRAVASALAQTYQNIEVVVVDDGSTDGSLGTVSDLSDPRLRVIRQDNAGKSVAMNRALGQISGAYYCILDADDEMLAERVAVQVAALEANPDVAAVFCGHELLLNGRRVAPRLRAKGREECREDIERFRMPAHDPTGMYRVSMVAGMAYDPELRIAQGYDYILRVGERWPMLVMRESLYLYRVHRGSVTKTDPERRRGFVRAVLERACARRNVPADDAPSFLNKSMTTARIADNGLATHMIESVVDLRSAGRVGEALRVGIACAAVRPLDSHYYKALAYAVLPSGVRRRLRPSEKGRLHLG